ncbi:MACPF domain-containing protein CAD1-like [Momordica charantia]|uniref:MACPF domain-containing protein CAD1-like n=1 Tax=Momordica charantia TaxID=3673 RepID=A0A6J1CR77_MOMCH|nr:MACPF domain-containing protein CAD1-like [Momordica charantia]
MGDTGTALHTAINAVQALGRGFDVNFDTRLLYCKGVSGSTIVEVDDEHTRDICLYDDVVLLNVSWDIKNFQEPIGHRSSGICSFDEMVNYFNQKDGLSEGYTSGSFNSAFGFNGSKQIDAATTKNLSMDGFYIPLAKFQFTKTPLVLQENVKRAIPTSWDPPSLASFIENFGTHVITSITIGGKDVIYVKQHQSSPLSTMEVKRYVQDIANQRFSDTQGLTGSGSIKLKEKGLDGGLFNNQGVYPQPTSAPYLTGKEDVTVIFRRRGGDDLEQNHVRWARTVRLSPDVIEMTFFPITALLDGVTGKEHLTRAILLYLEYKPPLEELRYFLEFQIPRVWAPVRDTVPGHQRKEPVCPSLQFSIMGQKLYVSIEQISIGRKPVTGMRLSLEGSKQNRLSIHLQHLASLPKILQPYWDTHVGIGAPKWQGPEEQDSRWFEPVKWKNFSHVSTAPIENPETFMGELSGVYIVTGAQLGVWDFGPRNVLYMKLLYSRLPGCTIQRTLWDHLLNDKSKKLVSSSDNSNADDSSSGSRNIQGNKLAKLVDTSEMSKGPHDPPGHWLVTGAKLGVEKGKIVLRVKYSLLNY